MRQPDGKAVEPVYNGMICGLRSRRGALGREQRFRELQQTAVEKARLARPRCRWLRLYWLGQYAQLRSTASEKSFPGRCDRRKGAERYGRSRALRVHAIARRVSCMQTRRYCAKRRLSLAPA